MPDIETSAAQLVHYYRGQGEGLNYTDAQISDLVIRDLKRNHPDASYAQAIKVTAAAIKRGEAWGTIDDEPAFREDWPYNFKWNFNNATGEPHVWRVMGGSDGRPVHRQMYEAQGWTKGDLVLGQGAYKPAALDAALVRLLYYPNTGTFVPEPIIDWFKRTFPDAAIQTDAFSPGALYK